MVYVVIPVKDSVEKLVQFYLNDYKPQHVRAPKLIHDTILGSNLFYPHEIAVLDSPLLQRLRRIGQVDIVPLVFPSGNHNRFEHTLGVTVIADKLARALRKKLREKRRETKDYFLDIEIDDNIIKTVRLAAILHDCGHGPMSHISEEVFKHCNDLELEMLVNEKLAGCSAHEALSYFIVTSDSFRKFINKIEKEYDVQFDLDLIGEMIIGYAGEPKKTYLKDIINGAFDADKLDYIQRDSHFTGIKMVLDLDRLFYSIDLVEDDEKRVRLTADISGTSTLEQVVFNKMMLFSVVYHHHKVRAAESLFYSIFEEIKINNLKIYDLEFKSAVDFLYLTDNDIYSLNRNKDKIASIAREMCYRRLPMRAMVLSNKTVSKESLPPFRKVQELYENPRMITVLREKISEETKKLGTHVLTSDIWLDIPRTPKFKEGQDWPIKSAGSAKGYIRLKDVIPVDEWVKAFSHNKWQGFVFTRFEYRKTVYLATKKILKEYFRVDINNNAKYLCKMDDFESDDFSEEILD